MYCTSVFNLYLIASCKIASCLFVFHQHISTSAHQHIGKFAIYICRMHIAVDARYLQTADSYEEQYLFALLQKLVQFQPQHQFTIITTLAGLLPDLPNIKDYLVENKIRSYLQLRQWYSTTLPGILQKAGAEVLLSINGNIANTAIRQVVFLSSPGAAVQPFAKSAFSPFFKKYLNSRLAKAGAIATVTAFQQPIIAKQLQVPETKIIPVGYCVPSFYNPLNWQQKENFLQKHMQGCEYFLYAGPFTPARFLLVLKAFSLFKKRQQSSMQLLVAGRFTIDKNLSEKLETYKYRADVKLYENPDRQQMPSLYAAAYGVIFLDETLLTAYPVAAAWQCEVPVISLQNATAVNSLAGTAALYAEATPESWPNR